MQRLVIITGALLLAVSADSTIRMRMTDKGLKFFAVVLGDELNKVMQNMPLPDEEIDEYLYDVNMTNMVSKRFQSSQFEFKLTQPDIIGLTTNGGEMDFTSDFSAVVHLYFTSMNVVGSVTGQASDFEVNFQMEIRSNHSTPQINIYNCSADVKKLTLKLKTEGFMMGYILNTLEGWINSYAKKKIHSKLCEVMTHEMTTKINKQLAAIPHKHQIFKNIQMDYEFENKMEVSPNYLQADVNWWVEFGEQMCSNIGQNVYCGSPQNERMLYLWISDQIPNCMFGSAYMMNYLNYTIDENFCDGNLRNLLRTTCQLNEKCIGNIFPSMGEKYPNRYASIRFFASSAPQYSTTAMNVIVSVDSILEVFVPGAENDRDAVAEILVDTDYSVIPSLLGRQMKWSLVDVNVAIREFGTEFSPSSLATFNELEKTIKFVASLIGTFVVSIEMRLPIVDHLTTATNSIIDLVPGSAIVELDFEHV